MQKQLRIWKARWWNMLVLAVSVFFRDSVKVYVFLYKLYKCYVCKKSNTVYSHPKTNNADRFY